MSQDPPDPSGESGPSTPQWGPPPQSWGTPMDSAAPDPQNPYSPQQAQQNPYGVPMQPGGWPNPQFQRAPKPGVVELRPLTLSDLLDGTFATIRRAPAATLGIAALVYLIIGILGMLAFGVLGLNEVLYAALSITGDPNEIAHFEDLLLGTFSHPWYIYAGIALVSFVLSILASAIIVGTSSAATMRATLNLPTSIVQSLRFSVSAWARIIWLNLLVGLGALSSFSLLIFIAFWLEASIGALTILPSFLLMFTLLLGFIFIGIRLVVAPVLIVTQSLGVFAAMGKSWRLTQGMWWRIFGIVLVTGLMISVLGGIISSIAGVAVSFSNNMWVVLIATQLVGSITTAVGASLYYVLLSLLHVDLRIRQERLDVALLNELQTPSESPLPGHDAVDFTRST